MSLPATLELSLSKVFLTEKPARLGIAVSGGGDSVALLHLMHDWAKAHGVSLRAATVDHGLRPEAKAEARMVAELCAGLGISHDILCWENRGRQGNLQDAARRARYALLADWAREKHLDAVALGHTSNDQAETFLMRLARGSGVDGLSAMRADWRANNMRWLRPLINASRQELRSYLMAKNIKWAEDSSNVDERFDRVKVRRVLDLLEPLGIDNNRLVDTAHHLTRARAALQYYAHIAAHEFCETQYGDVLIAKQAAKLPDETYYRLVSHALMWVASAQYRPRFDALVETLEKVQAGERRSLHGCLISPEDESIRISREYQVVKGETCMPGKVWDSRWRLKGKGKGVQVRALGEAVKEAADWRKTGLPRASLMATPAIWRDEELIAAPVAGLTNGWQAEIHPQMGDFFASVLSH